MKLSIGIMVKNEEKYLNDCLGALAPIFKSIDSELIIVDTGSTDKTVEIAKKFTDKVYFHKWNNNFSEMRNKVLEYCSGEWFFYVDGDEILESCSGIIEFLNDKNCIDYNTVNINIKNLTNINNLDKYSVFSAPRLFRNDENFKFLGAIHNQPVLKNPIKYLNDSCLHYGYIHDDDELMERKFHRTSSILKRELEKDPHNIYYMYQLSVSYGMHKEYKKATKQINIAYNYIKENKKDISKTFYVLPQLFMCYFNECNYKETKRYCRECIKYNSKYIDAYYYMGHSYFRLEEYENAKIYFEKYVKLVEEYYHSEIKNTTIYYTICDLEQVYFKLFEINRILKLNKQALTWLKKIQNINIIEIFIEFCITKQMYDDIEQYIKSSENNLSEKYRYIEKFLLIKNINFKEHLKLSKRLRNLNGAYGALNKIRMQYFTKSIYLLESIRNFIEDFNFELGEDYYGDVLYYCIKYEINISDILKDVSIKVINNYFNYISIKYNDFHNSFYNYTMVNCEEVDFYSQRINKEICRYAILKGDFKGNKFENIFTSYVDKGIKYIKNVYSPFIIEKERVQDVRNEEEAFFIYLNKAIEVEKNDELSYIRYLKKALKSYNYMKEGIELIINKKLSYVLEMKKCRKELKITIETLINNGNLENAKNLINEYENINKEDIDIYSMKGIIAIMENRLKDAEYILLKGLSIENNNFELVYNLAFLYGLQNEKELELEFYKKSLNNCLDFNIRNDIIEKINELRLEFINIEMNSELIESIDYNSKEEIIKYIKCNIENNNSEECNKILNFYFEKCYLSIGEVYYFMACYYNKLKLFDQALKYHNIAIRVSSTLSNIVERNKISSNFEYKQKQINCIGCGCDKYETVNVCNQSVSETNKGMINPIRIWVKCKKCGLVYINPMPIEEEMNKYYSMIAPEKFNGIYGKIKDRENFLINMSKHRLNNIKKLTNKKNILDIGTGIGVFVKTSIDEGFNAQGIELTREDCEYAKKNYNLNLIQKNFYSFKDDEKYDIVTMFEVIEHMRTPLKDLCRINKLVKMDGIFVIATPILDSEYAKKEKDKNVFWNVVSHLTYFNRSVLTNYLSYAGFKIINITNSKEGMGRMDFYCKKIKEVD